VPIADCNGHLLPHIKKNPCSSPWGNYAGWIWEEPTMKCDCVDRIRNPQDYDRAQSNILVSRERQHHNQEAQHTANAISSQLFKPEPEAQVSVMNSECPQLCENE
jgi:hypothetical protein